MRDRTGSLVLELAASFGPSGLSRCQVQFLVIFEENKKLPRQRSKSFIICIYSSLQLFEIKTTLVDATDRCVLRSQIHSLIYRLLLSKYNEVESMLSTEQTKVSKMQFLERSWEIIQQQKEHIGFLCEKGGLTWVQGWGWSSRQQPGASKRSQKAAINSMEVCKGEG